MPFGPLGQAPDASGIRRRRARQRAAVPKAEDGIFDADRRRGSAPSPVALRGQLARLMPITRARARGSLSNRAANCSVIAPASCSTSVIVTARS